jgi:radical SAM-linked protein
VARTPDGPPPPPAVQKLRIHFAKRGRLRFSSHRDFQRAFERALRRAGVPMAYSAGFSPHPKVSYAGAAPTGVASEAEYLELSVTERVDPERLRQALDASLPPGLDVLDVVEAGPGALADLLEASVWEIRLPGVSPRVAAAAAEAFLAKPRVQVQRLTKNGMRSFDARESVLALGVGAATSPVAAATSPVAAATGKRAGSLDAPGDSVAPPEPMAIPDAPQAAPAGVCAILRLVVRHVTPSVRPDDVLAALRQVADLVPPAPPSVTRLAQGPLDEATCQVADPLSAAGPDPGAVGVAVATAAP